jgi:hypothetical protein
MHSVDIHNMHVLYRDILRFYQRISRLASRGIRCANVLRIGLGDLSSEALAKEEVPKRERVRLVRMQGTAGERYTRVCAARSNAADGPTSRAIRFARSAILRFSCNRETTSTRDYTENGKVAKD